MLPKAQISHVEHYANFGAGNGGEQKTSVRTKAKRTGSEKPESRGGRGVAGQRSKELWVGPRREPSPEDPSSCPAGAPPLWASRPGGWVWGATLIALDGICIIVARIADKGLMIGTCE